MNNINVQKDEEWKADKNYAEGIPSGKDMPKASLREKLKVDFRNDLEEVRYEKPWVIAYGIELPYNNVLT
jgi:hypothetical protein